MTFSSSDSGIENTRAQIRKGLLEFCILLTIKDRSIYSSDILEQLKSSNLLVVEGTLYPLLSRLKTNGLLAYRWEESPSGPPRKYYHLTDKGKESLENLLITWDELQSSIQSLIHHSNS